MPIPVKSKVFSLESYPVSKDSCFNVFVITSLVISTLTLLCGILTVLACNGYLSGINSLLAVGEINGYLMGFGGLVLFIFSLVAWKCHRKRQESKQPASAAN